MTVFIDSGGWLSVTLPSDRHHRAGRQYFQSLISLRAVATTSDFVLQEVITRLRYDAGHRIASEFIALIHEAVDDRRLTVHRITPELWETAEEFFLRYHDAVLSFTDCSSFALLREHPVDEVFGYDSHFEMMGHILRPKP
jgi:hypothetical protein